MNIGLRAIASPPCFHANPRLRLKAKKSAYLTRSGVDANKREAVLCSKATPVIFKNWDADIKEETRINEHINLFFDPFQIANWGHAEVPGIEEKRLALQKAVLGTVNQMKLKVCERINHAHLEKLGIEEDDILI